MVDVLDSMTEKPHSLRMDALMDVETRESQLNELRAVDPAMMPLGHTLGFRTERVSAGEAMVVLPSGCHLNNLFGYMHGGAIFAIADTAIGLAYVASLDPGKTGTTVESKINFLRPVLSGELQAFARCVNQGKSLSFYECDVRDDRDRLIARVSATMMTLDDRRSGGRSQLYEPTPEVELSTAEGRNR